ncbi:hypothetical protein DPMN_134491 [Dreissena polymorpha]|uniref:Uncharacterized protein n=1 Tax=Dreissena polymorpha TaxID=45954 RepID=A0A9D4G073_DREPO|nr:hypothetical protein DPMN_134491 [Dreissena polymorpha]
MDIGNIRDYRVMDRHGHIRIYAVIDRDVESTRPSISGQRLSVVNIDLRRCKGPTVQNALEITEACN